VTPEQVRTALSGELAPATLVLGPGAWDLVTTGRELDWAFRRDLDVAMAREVCEMAGWAPARYRRVLALNLDGASDQVQNILLKVLEEPPRTTRFVLAAEGKPPLPTVASRCRVLVLGHGQPEAVQVADSDKAAVGVAVRAAVARQVPELSQAVRGWWKDAKPGEAPAQVRLLETWAAEAATGQWQVFEPGLAPEVSPDQALHLLSELARSRGSRLGPVVALQQVFCRE
jgi:DNA polymerase III, delta subunit